MHLGGRAPGGTVTTVDSPMRGTPFFHAARALVAETDRAATREASR
ncbi:hypothetical protein [Streptomyces pacificus]|uniref:Uncharacterized protein n=1 Tax=Streptomyces pacificus TaxID=2705029 RepID=A0A6A0B288_9ACTN|nr:hypothetical protein [Streptomyces pacificus]GFH37887.1 hypothetical protein SCWH03_41270 [Streptomyces pacificus]